jgi:hypothetical protein
MKIPIILLITFSVVFSCRKTQSGDDTIQAAFNFKERPEISNLNLTDLNFSEIEYIKLETTDSFFITCGNHPLASGQLIVCDSFYLIQCGNDVLLFKENGLFERKIGTVGRGPDEFTVAHDVQYDERSKRIYLLGGWQKKFFVYSMRGELLRTFKIPFLCQEFRIVENGLLCYSMNHMGNVEQSYNLIDTNGLILKSYINKYPFNNHDGYTIIGENLFYTFNNRLHKKEVYSDTIFYYLNGEFKPHIVISLGNSKLITPAIRSQNKGFFLAQNYIIPLKLFEFGNYVYYEFFYKFDFSNSEIYSFVGSKDNDFYTFFDRQTGIINDLDGGPDIFPCTIKDESTIIAFVDALQFRKHISSAEFRNYTPKYPDKKIILEEFARNVKETDNPVLVLVRLKNRTIEN